MGPIAYLQLTDGNRVGRRALEAGPLLPKDVRAAISLSIVSAICMFSSFAVKLRHRLWFLLERSFE
jgi:hypothetical protein